MLNRLVQRFEPEGNALQISIIIIILKNEVCGVVCTLEAALINQFDGTKTKNTTYCLALGTNVVFASQPKLHTATMRMKTNPPE